MAHAGEEALWLELKDERRAVLSAAPASPRDLRLSGAAVALSVLVFAAAAPFAKTPLTPVPAFLPAYQAALIISDLVTAALLFGQFAILRRTGLLVLGSAYLFSALMAVSHALSFPGLSPISIGAGSQTTAWLYFLWHGAFPLFLIGYAVLPDERRPPVESSLAIAAAIGGVVLIAVALTVLTTAGHGTLPVIMDGNRDAPAKAMVATACWTLCVAALVLLWRRRPRTVLDLWLMVVMCAWIFDIALAAVLNGGRFDVGWYAGRIYGLLAASFVLIVLLLENSILYAQLIGAYGRERLERQRVQEKTAELSAANRELDAFSYSVSHDLRAPLRHIGGFAEILKEETKNLPDSAKECVQIITDSTKRMNVLIDDLLEFSRLGRQEVRKAEVDMAGLVNEVIFELTSADKRAQIVVAELPAAMADRGLIRHVWTNLVGNAIKYSGKRADPRVEISARTEGDAIVYSVRDNGAGFDMRYADKLFGVFQRLHRPDEFPGTGVGLAIVQRIVSRHGGRIWAEAEPGAGATFHFSL